MMGSNVERDRDGGCGGGYCDVGDGCCGDGRMWLCINLMVVKVMKGRCQGDKLGCYGDGLCGSQGDMSESL